MPDVHLKPFGSKPVPSNQMFFLPKRSPIMAIITTRGGQKTTQHVPEQIRREGARTKEANIQAQVVIRTDCLPASLNVTRLKSPGNEGGDAALANASPSPHSPAQPHVVQRYGRAEYVGVVGAG